MSDLDLGALKALAERATPGPWEAGDGWVYTMPVYDDDLRLSNVLGMKFLDSEREAAERERGRCNAEFIAAANPETVLALIGRVQAAEAVIAEVQDAYDATLHPDQSPDGCGACRIERALARYMKGVGDE